MSAATPQPLFSENAAHAGEHISLQSEVEVRAKPATHKSIVEYQLRSRAHGTQTRVGVLQDHFVAVNLKRIRGGEQNHIVDLRFVDPRPAGVRKVAWRWLYTAIAFTLLAVVAVLFTTAFATPSRLVWAVPAAVALCTFSISSYLLCLYFTTESLVFVSMHGRARVITITGGLGTCRAARKCALDVVKHVHLARRQLKQTRPAYLRDEMREHSRLHSEGVLAQEQYEEARTRILAAHD